jgi:hypothetical protein
MIHWLENALVLGALGSLAYAIFGLAMTLHCRRPGTSLWFWPGMWTLGIWSVPVTERGALYRDRFMRALSATVVCLGLYFLLIGRR